MPTREDAKAAAVAAPEKTDVPESKVEAPTAAPAEKPKREPKAKAEPTDCACKVPDHDRSGAPATGDAVKFPGCRGGKSTRKFAPGHDAKLVGFVTRQYAAGKVTAEAAIEEVRTKSANSALLVGKIKAAVKRVDDERASRERREQAEKDAKSAEQSAPATPESPADSPEAEVDALAAASAE